MPQQDYTAASTTTWECPAGCLFAIVEVWGGGGGGGGSATKYGSGGGGGGYSKRVYMAPAAGSYPVVVGAGGAGGTTGAGGGGGDSYFNTNTSADVLAKGGGAGGYNAALGGAGGAAASGYGDVKTSGGNGAQGGSTTPAGGGGSGGTLSGGTAGRNTVPTAAPAVTGGGPGGEGGSSGTDGATPVSGPGGGGGGAGKGTKAGGRGHDGRVLITWMVSTAPASSTRFPSVAVASASAPYSDDPWEGPTGAITNILADDTAYAYITSLGFDTGHHSYLATARGFGFELPAGATVEGFLVEVLARRAAGAASWALMQIVDHTGAPAGDNRAADVGAMQSADVRGFFGGPTDTWGAPLTAEMVNDADFGVQFAIQATADNTDVYVEYLKATVFYSLGPEWTGLAVQINGGAASTDDNDVTLTLAGTADGSAPDQVAFSDNGTDWSAWEAYHASRAYQLAAQASYPTATRTVYVKFRTTVDGTLYESDPVSDSIDLAVVWTRQVLINGGAPQAYGATVDLAFSATSSAGSVTHYRLREDAGAWSAWTTYTAARTLELDGLGSHTVDAQFLDDDGNTSPGCTASITVLDETEAAEIITTEPVQVIRAGILAYMGDTLVAELEAIAGEVTADSRRSVWRTATIDFAPTEQFTFFEIYQLLATPGLELVVRRGWRTSQGDDVIISLGRFVVDEVSMSEGEDGTAVSVNASDLATRIQRARFTDPYAIASGTALATALAELLLDRWSETKIGFDTSTVPNELGAKVVLEAGDSSDPWTDAQNIAQAHGYVLFFDAEGVVRLQPAPDPNTVTPTYFYHRDEHAVVVSQSRVAPMERTYSGVVVTGEGSGLATPVRAEAWDEGPQSPTNVNGPFGYVPYFYSSPLITTTDQAKDVALAMLSSVTGRVEQLSFELVPNPAVKPLDAVEVEDSEGYFHTYLLDEVTTPLSPTEAMSSTARETRTDTLWVADDYLS